MAVQFYATSDRAFGLKQLAVFVAVVDDAHEGAGSHGAGRGEAHVGGADVQQGVSGKSRYGQTGGKQKTEAGECVVHKLSFRQCWAGLSRSSRIATTMASALLP